MQTAAQIKAAIKELKREMKANGIRRTSCFNGGLDRTTYSYNAQLFKLTTELQRAEKEAA